MNPTPRRADAAHRAGRRIAVALALALAAGGVAACGDTDDPTPPPEVIATAESIATPVKFEAPAASDPDEADGEPALVLDGRVFGDGPTGVILAHMRLDDQSSWYPLATELADTGEFTVLTFDFRGFGESEGEKQFDRVDADLEAAVQYARRRLGLEKIFLVGASMGGTASLVVAARDQVAGVVAISAPSQFPPLDAVEAVSDINSPKLFVVSENDVPQFRAQQEFWEMAREPKAQHVYEGDTHGTALLTSPHGDDLRRRILDFLRGA